MAEDCEAGRPSESALTSTAAAQALPERQVQPEPPEPVPEQQQGLQEELPVPEPLARPAYPGDVSRSPGVPEALRPFPDVRAE